MKIKSRFSPAWWNGEVNTLPSMTIPDVSVSIRQAVANNLRGTLPAAVVNAALYSNSDDFDDVLQNELQDYDFTDKQYELNKLREKFEWYQQVRQRHQEESSTAPDDGKIPSGQIVKPEVMPPRGGQTGGE